MRNLTINPEVFDVEYDEDVIFEEFEDGKVKFQLGLLGEDRYPGINVLIDDEEEGSLITGDSMVYIVEVFDQLKIKIMPNINCGWIRQYLSDDWTFKEQN